MCLYFGGSVFCIAALFKLQHWPGGDNVMLVVFALSCLYWFLAIVELMVSSQIKRKDKYFWAVLLGVVFVILFFFFVPLLFLLLQSGYLKWSKPYFSQSKQKSVSHA